MLIKKVFYTVVVMIIYINQSFAAMYINEGGTGQVLIYPYYTVNNGLNTIYSVVNTTPDTKAIKVKFLEGQNGAEVLDFNVYLDGYDVWEAVLVPGSSTVAGHIGEETAIHIDNDFSCTPYLQEQQEFLPFVIDQDFNNNNLQRSKEGQIVIYETSTFFGNTTIWADHGTSGVPNNCEAIEDEWNDSIYDTDDEGPVTGGLMGSVSIIDVANGMAINIEALAIDDFWINNIAFHSAPGSLLPNLNFGDSESQIRSGTETLNSTWSSSVKAVTSLLMHNTLHNEYIIDPVSESSSEWVVSFPTKSFFTNANQAIQPFSELWNGFTSCEPFTFVAWDREELQNNSGPTPEFCYQTNVMEIKAPGQPSNTVSSILGSNNLLNVMAPDNPNTTPGGWISLMFEGVNQAMTSLDGNVQVGLPAIGFQVEKYTNAAAQPGLLAQYLAAKNHRSTQFISPANKLNDMTGGEQ